MGLKCEAEPWTEGRGVTRHLLRRLDRLIQSQNDLLLLEVKNHDWVSFIAWEQGMFLSIEGHWFGIKYDELYFKIVQ